MTEDKAFRVYAEYRTERARQPQSNKAIPLKDGSWLFVEADEQPPMGRYTVVAVRAGGEVFPLDGALGKVFRAFPDLGPPISCERFLGATAFGRYQAFDSGVAIWEGRENIGYPVLESLSPLRRQLCIVAFFDLRGFTSWSKDAASDDVQHAISAFEAAVHEGFPIEQAPWNQIFLKGTGDGVMIVSQADWHASALLNSQMTVLAPGHARDFLNACERTIFAGRERLANHFFPLAIGCGIASGVLDRVFLFGRHDYIGASANEAAKIQQLAWNEICITRGFGEVLKLDERDVDAEWELATKGWRLRSPQ